jgi:ABC-type bacteriocin/lantibiotic exporter with double-glycine peptidase domain
MRFFAEIFISLIVISILMMASWRATLILLILLISLGLLISIVNRNRLKKIGLQYAESEKQRAHYILDVIYGHKEIRILNKIEFYLRKHRELIEKSKTYGALESFYHQVPRIIIELAVSIGACLCYLIYYLTQKIATLDLITIIIFTIGFFRILPSINRILSSVQSINYSSSFMSNILVNYNKIESKNPHKEENQSFHIQSLVLKGVSYWHAKKIFDDININLNIGNSLFINGPSGSGKSTLVDLIIGFYKPNTGLIYFLGKDGCAISPIPKLFSYVDQHPFFFNGTVRENIYIDSLEVNNHFEIFNALEIKDLMDLNIKTLSGGQKKRVAIARALILDRDIIVLDEATNGLDNELTNKILEYLIDFCKNKILIMISHDLYLRKYFNMELRLNG